MLGGVVFTFYNNKPYRVDDISFEMTPLSTFNRGKHGPITYVDYYKKVSI